LSCFKARHVLLSFVVLTQCCPNRDMSVFVYSLHASGVVSHMRQRVAGMLAPIVQAGYRVLPCLLASGACHICVLCFVCLLRASHMLVNNRHLHELSRSRHSQSFAMLNLDSFCVCDFTSWTCENFVPSRRTGLEHTTQSQHPHSTGPQLYIVSSWCCAIVLTFAELDRECSRIAFFRSWRAQPLPRPTVRRNSHSFVTFAPLTFLLPFPAHSAATPSR
jgi:hypothetical protein